MPLPMQCNASLCMSHKKCSTDKSRYGRMSRIQSVTKVHLRYFQNYATHWLMDGLGSVSHLVRLVFLRRVLLALKNVAQNVSSSNEPAYV